MALPSGSPREETDGPDDGTPNTMGWRADRLRVDHSDGDVSLDTPDRFFDLPADRLPAGRSGNLPISHLLGLP